MKKKMLSMISLCLLIGGTFGCSSAYPSSSLNEEIAHAEKLPSLVDEWKEYLHEDNLSKYERTVLEQAIKTGHIKQEDYEEGYSQYLKCMTNAGYDSLVYDKMPDGLYSLSNDAVVDDGYFEQSVACSEGTIRVIEAAYRNQQDNPKRYKDSGILAAQCLHSAGVVDDSYTAAQFNMSMNELKGNTSKNPSEVFGFPISAKDTQTLYCLYLGDVGLSFDGTEG